MQVVVLKIPLRTLNKTKTERLELLRSQFTDCVRFHWSRVEALKSTNATVIHRDCYKAAREQFTLPASTVQQARDKAIAAYRSYLTRRKNDRRANPPAFRKPLPLRLAAQDLRVYANGGMLRVTTPNGSLWLPLEICERHRSQLVHKHGASELVKKGDRWFLMLTVKLPDVPVNDGGPHFGLDLGLANAAVLAGPDTNLFFDGKPLRATRARFLKYRQALQVKRKTGMLKRSRGRETRWVTNENHRISRRVVDKVAQHKGILHVENLVGIRERCKGTKKVNRMLSSWPFAQLLSFIKYKAALAGVPVIEEDPRHTSQRCSRCGHTERANRPKQADFHCQSCGFLLHADLNAARNLAAKGTCPLGSGGVTPPLNGEPMSGRKTSRRGNRNLAS